MNLAYKHLESKLKIGEFTITQWAGFFVGVMAALIWAMYLSPFGAYITLVTSVYLGGLPAGAAFLASVSDLDLWLHLKALVRHRRMIGRYVSGPGVSVSGYVLTADRSEGLVAASVSSHDDLDLAELWH
jgi:hypothetical protein